MKNNKNILNYFFGKGSISNLSKILDKFDRNEIIILIDDYFKNISLDSFIYTLPNNNIYYLSTKQEPSTFGIDQLKNEILKHSNPSIQAIVAIGGGSILDTGKAIANLLTSPGSAEIYQGWDLVKNPAIYKIGIPTISGTGSESTRTCVMTNYKTGLKLGMNSDHTLYDQLILDPNLTKTVPRNQYFYTGMDTFIHCMESLKGNHRHAVSDAFSREAMNLCDEVFYQDDDMMSNSSREKLMVASYLGGMAVANSYVGVVHPFSAGLSVVLGFHHCIANCIAMRAMAEFYHDHYKFFWDIVKKNHIEIPKNVTQNLSEEQFNQLYKSTIMHEKPLRNALGDSYLEILNKQRVIEIFKMM